MEAPKFDRPNVLGHRLFEPTNIYAKLDEESLHRVAVPAKYSDRSVGIQFGPLENDVVNRCRSSWPRFGRCSKHRLNFDELRLENLALRHQVAVLRRCAAKRWKIAATDRLLWVCFRRLWAGWKAAWSSSQRLWSRGIGKGSVVLDLEGAKGPKGRPSIPAEIQDLICTISRNNRRWGAPRIHRELLKLGIQITYQPSPSTWFAIESRRLKTGERSSIITSPAWFRLTCWRMSADESNASQ
jgi:hypothetical protein